MPISIESIERYISQYWDEHIVPSLVEYIKIPCLSVDFDPDWPAQGYMDQAKDLAVQWIRQHAAKDWTLHEQSLPGRTPLLLIEVPGQSEETFLLYGHLDKQPEMEGWWEGFGPWTPVIKDHKLYGRGGADDGYALFASIAALKAISEQGLPHPRIVILIEFSEESGSPDLSAYLETYKNIIGRPDLVVALDSGAGDYERLWSTTSLRGMLSCSVKVEVLSEATHSGIASGLVPSSMRVMRRLLDRLEDSVSGRIRLQTLHAEIPQQRLQQARDAAAILGEQMFAGMNVVEGLQPVVADPYEQLLNTTWRPTLCVVGQEGMPAIKKAGNVLRAYTTFKLSFRFPPSMDYRDAQKAIESVLNNDPPYNAKVTVRFDQGGSGWDAPPLAPWLAQASSEASTGFYGRDACYVGLGASIPFMAMLGKQYPKAQFLITGVLGPKSNAHGPNEFIHIPYAKKLTACVAYIIARYLQLK